VNRKFVDIDVVKDWLGPYFTSNWKKLETWIMFMRKEKNNQKFGEHFQLLYKEIIK